MKWKSHAEHYREALVYMKKRQQGLESSFKTCWPKINNATLGGFEYHSITLVGGRPGAGKTLFKDQAIREGLPLNAGDDVRVLEFQLEMVGRNSKLREFSAITKKTYKYLCSAEVEGIVVSDEIIEVCKQHALKAAALKIDIIDEPVFASEFRSEIIEYMEKYHKIDTKVVKDKDGNEHTKEFKVYSKTLVTLDHSVLIRKAKGQQTLDMLNQLGEVCTELKKRYPIAFILLSQLNREVMSPGRCENGKIGNYLNDGDFFGADALMQHADTVIAWDRPALRHISVYGPDKFLIEDDTVLVAHVIKARTGDTRMSFFRAAYNEMSIYEMETPPQEPIKTSRKKEDD